MASSGFNCGWYAVALSSDVKANAKSVFTAVVGGSLYCLVRQPSGKVRAYTDVCPHRGMSMSEGKIEKGCMVCPYHGAQFNLDGACVKYPPAPGMTIPAKFSLKEFPVHEEFGLIWMAVSDASSAGSSPVTESSSLVLPRCEALKRTSWRLFNGSTSWNSEYSVATCASLDPSLMMKRLNENAQIRGLFEQAAGGKVSATASLAMPGSVTLEMSAGAMKLVCFMSHCPEDPGNTSTRYVCGRNFMTSGLEASLADLLARQSINLAMLDLKKVMKEKSGAAQTAEELSCELNGLQSRYLDERKQAILLPWAKRPGRS